MKINMILGCTCVLKQKGVVFLTEISIPSEMLYTSENYFYTNYKIKVIAVSVKAILQVTFI